jgi:hypothetical protein
MADGKWEGEAPTCERKCSRPLLCDSFGGGGRLKEAQKDAHKSTIDHALISFLKTNLSL